jgi:signal transduction histidine kinase/ActR/RegA family two-component response regulator
MHNLLRRQLKHHFPDGAPTSLAAFLSAIDQAYVDFDLDRRMLERSLDLSSQELLKANADLRALIGAFPDLFFRLDGDGRILDCKGGGKKGFMLEEGQLVGRRIQDVPIVNVGSAFQQALEQVRTTLAPASLEYALEVQGQRGFFEARLLPVFGGEFIALIRDITDRKQAEASLLSALEQLRQSQKMEAMGRLAGGVAHDFNNLLTAIMGYCDLALNRVEEKAPIQKDLLEIQRVSERAAGLTRRLLAFSRHQVIQPRFVDLNEIVASVQTMLKRLIGETIHLAVLLDPQLPLVLVDPLQIEQVILNLVINARDAQSKGGWIIIETSGFRNPEGRGVSLSVTDTGHGMDQGVLSHLFEPFFTTKEPGQGTGLGLSMVFGIVQQSEGTIQVDSEPGWGTTFRVTLPAAEGVQDRAVAKASAWSGAEGSETILLVEDEDSVREVAKNILQSSGYRVITARNGEEALDLVAGCTETISLLFTDLVMPGLGGRELVNRLRDSRPRLRVLCTSGYIDHPGFFANNQHKDLRFLQKPYSASELTKAVRATLDGETGDRF